MYNVCEMSFSGCTSNNQFLARKEDGFKETAAGITHVSTKKRLVHTPLTIYGLFIGSPY